ncbi:UL16-binding protein 3-like isoform X6 [Muntiacus reevesi]|uniref:UL16-binding protein 3-like isoform X6 n=1 Tax=Muntiacus reevesi TaxID=9886 RepID=UPI0033075354
MDWTAGPRAPLGFAALLLLGRLSISAARGYAHSLCYNFTIDPQPSRGEPWCVVQGQVDGNVFLSYDCGGAKVQSTSPLGEVVRTMNTWETQTETLRDIGDFLKWQLPDVILEKHMASENGHWTVVHSEGRRMKEKWENDRAATDFLKKVSMRDCWAGLQDFMVRWEKMLKSAESPTMGPSSVQPRATAIHLITGITAAVLACCSMSILTWILYKKRRCYPHEAPDRCSVCLWPQSLLGCFCSPAVHFRARKSDIRNPKSLYQF